MISFLLFLLWWLIGFVCCLFGIRESNETPLKWSDVLHASLLGFTGPVLPALFVVFAIGCLISDGFKWAMNHPALNQPVFTTKVEAKTDTAPQETTDA